jgi:hypothetical protein
VPQARSKRGGITAKNFDGLLPLKTLPLTSSNTSDSIFAITSARNSAHIFSVLTLTLLEQWEKRSKGNGSGTMKGKWDLKWN